MNQRSEPWNALEFSCFRSSVGNCCAVYSHAIVVSWNVIAPKDECLHSHSTFRSRLSQADFTGVLLAGEHENSYGVNDLMSADLVISANTWASHRQTSSELFFLLKSTWINAEIKYYFVLRLFSTEFPGTHISWTICGINESIMTIITERGFYE